MANVTQTIPNLTQGISQQPDEYKLPGQVKNMVNALPDITQGLLKRPAGKFVASLSDGTKNSTADGKWFHYYRDENEQYVGQIAKNGTVRMWDCLTGAEKNVVNPQFNYLQHTGDEDLQTLTLNDFTYINNRTKTVEMDTLTEPDTNFGKEIFIELKSISYAKQYAVNVFDSTAISTVTTATRINVTLVNSSNNYCDSAFKMRTHATRGDGNNARCGEPAGDGRDAYAPNVGTRIFSVGTGTTLVDEGATGGTLANGNHSDINYSYTVNIFNSSNQGSQQNRKNLYFRIATTGQSVPYTTGTGSNQQTTYQARYTTQYDLLHGGEGWQTGDYFYVFMRDAYYKVTIEATSESKVQANLGLVRPQPTPFDTETTITAESILGDIRTELIAGGSFSNSDITTIGTGLHIKRSSVFNASTPVGELLNVVAGKVQDVGDLPSQCKHGMVVEVVNGDADEDNHFVKFFGNNDRDGEGTWEECAKPGRKIRLKRDTMPIVLIRTADGNFRLTELDGSAYTVTTADGPVTSNAPQWDDCLVGDEVTNPEPSFVGKQINKMLFFRNRFSILADENIVMSRPGDFTNFWAKSAIQFIASDPVDIAASSEYPAILFDGIQTNTGLVLFSKNQQFMLTTDSDVLSPATAKVNAIANYNFNHKTNPISLGTTVGFLDNANKYSRFFEMSNLLREGEPIVVEQSKVVSTLLSNELKLISNSRENSIIFFSEENTPTLYAYRYFQSGNERAMEAWFTWTLTGDIRYHCFLDDALYVVVKNGTKDQLLRYNITLDSNSHFVTSGVDFPVHLDHSMTTSGWTYNAQSNKSTKIIPSGLESSTAQLAAYDNSNNQSGVQNLGRYAKVTVLPVSNNNTYIEIDGDWSNETFIIGYLFDMNIQIPTIYLKQQAGDNWRADTRCDLIIHRIKFNFGNVGVYSVTIDKLGKPTFTEEREVNQANVSTANNPNFLDSSFETIPCYERNKTLTINISSKHPSPATILSYNWEGDYNNRNYRSV